jgi:hypothetical protein
MLKSTFAIRLAVIVTSPTMMSAPCIHIAIAQFNLLLS